MEASDSNPSTTINQDLITINDRSFVCIAFQDICRTVGMAQTFAGDADFATLSNILWGCQSTAVLKYADHPVRWCSSCMTFECSKVEGMTLS